MSDPGSLSARARAELFSVSSVVILIAAVFALAGAYLAQAWTDGMILGVGALLGVGIGVPTLYDEWGVDITGYMAFLWAVLASAISLAVYAIVFVLLSRFGADAGLGDVLAGGATVVLGIVFSLYRTRIA